MDMIRISVLAVTGAVCSLCIKKYHPEIAMVISFSTGILILYFVMDIAVDIVLTIKNLADSFSINTDYIVVLLKVTGITFIGEFIISTLKDVGEGGIATRVEVYTKMVILTMAIPIFMDLITIAANIVS